MQDKKSKQKNKRSGMKVLEPSRRHESSIKTKNNAIDMMATRKRFYSTGDMDTLLNNNFAAWAEDEEEKKFSDDDSDTESELDSLNDDDSEQS